MSRHLIYETEPAAEEGAKPKLVGHYIDLPEDERKRDGRRTPLPKTIILNGTDPRADGRATSGEGWMPAECTLIAPVAKRQLGLMAAKTRLPGFASGGAMSMSGLGPHDRKKAWANIIAERIPPKMISQRWSKIHGQWVWVKVYEARQATW